jgi:tyrosinase
VSPNVLGGKILQADLYAGVAAINQQIYQATQKPDQFKKCNPLNLIVRKEW